MEHFHHSINNIERSLINLQPHVEGCEHLCAKVLARQRHDVVQWPGDSLQSGSVC